VVDEGLVAVAETLLRPPRETEPDTGNPIAETLTSDLECCMSPLATLLNEGNQFMSVSVRSTSAAHLTFGPRLRQVSSPNVRCKSYTRIIELLVFLLVPTFAPNRTPGEGKCRNRNTSAAKSRSAALFSAATVATSVALICSILLGPASASAKDVTEKVMNACRGDYKRFCPAYSVNTPELNNCMTQAGKRKSLTPRCFNALVDDGFVPRKYLKQ